MKRVRWSKLIAVSTACIVAMTTFSSISIAHPGRTDSNGGHTCRTKCEKWGLEYGEYHYHNGGSKSSSKKSSSSKSSNSSKSSSSSKSTTKNKNNAKPGNTTNKQAKENKPVVTEVAAAITLNKETTKLPIQAVRHDSQLMLPLIDTLKALQANYSVKDNKIYISSAKRQVIVPIKHNHYTFSIDGTINKLAAPMIVYKGKFMVPLQLLRDALPSTVEWNESAKTINISR
ncbi:copper amine oxidase N-terminal domain-containing protein [Paenibacillus popilliae]|uniref:Copper amine oxidase N-terminal domain-containing protein n=2 Tax=Paenibacillus popilliae TaxID=78057 RepID=A0ABY3AWT7_PAEPP|nr:copper amine oxidase N-terminal domain-containing protein [Paenibacillus sp. SDF0028]TQR47070.1 copper amine oxidase N-terminal domain-containing protein [Paenibacillus sp. SDF0028]